MYADCPNCRRQFVVRAQHLSMAGGEVRCGFCGTQFNALDRLHDSPLPDLSPQPVEEAEAEPQFDVPDSLPASAPEPQSVPALEAQPLQKETSLHGRYQPRSALPPEWAFEPGQEEREPRRRLWGAAALVLLALALLQAAWFNRDLLLVRFPQVEPYAEQLCARMQCSVVRNRDLAAMKLVNRDVRLHPRYENVLLVNATITSESVNPQPYPRVQLALYDTNGATLAYRAFAPEEYLDRSVDRRAGMAAGVPVHFVLEVTGPTEGAVSFEFGFL